MCADTMMMTCLNLNQLVLPFVTENVANTNWQFRDAVLLSFGSRLTDLVSIFDI